MQPAKVKHRKHQKGRLNGNTSKGASLAYGTFGIKVVEKLQISEKQIETIRVMLNRELGKTGKLWIKVFPDKPITMKPAGVRMGSGKGEPDHFASAVRPGFILFEVSGIPVETFKNVAKTIGDKLRVKIKTTIDREFNEYWNN